MSTAEKSLYVDIGKIDLGSLTMYDFTKPTIQVNFADPRSARMVGSTGAVYGTITLTLLNQKGDLRIGRKKDNLVDIYDFNMDGRWMRDKLTKLGIYIATVNGKYKITSFNIYGYGKAKIPNMR
ncbi:hypothetical protein [Flavobacterium cerinum]|uniref:Uncharacterized protein n=1 Tax=Flavobacterium cerinum TaxID=2502784 RepID=A0ABY5IYA8_9FLAO|nr:hypothetical protein [Flavobacterium cerinum]UUC46713.1 hypothetical protein NOX80_05810 [Flavobacterium cerinum]